MERDNLRIKIYDDSAWVLYNEINHSYETGLPIEYLVTKILEKKDEKWGIVYTSVIQKSSYNNSDNGEEVQ